MKTALVFWALALFSIAQASEFKVKTLLEACGAPDTSRAMGVCIGYVMAAREKQFSYIFGFMDGAGNERGIGSEDPGEETVSLALDTSNVHFGCMGGKRNDQLAAVFVKWANENPEDWHLPAMTGFKVAISEAFPPPCE